MSRKYTLCIEWALSIGVATMANKKALFVMLVDRIPQFETHWSQFFAEFDWFVVLILRSVMVVTRQYWDPPYKPLPFAQCYHAQKGEGVIAGFYGSYISVLWTRMHVAIPIQSVDLFLAKIQSKISLVALLSVVVAWQIECGCWMFNSKLWAYPKK